MIRSVFMDKKTLTVAALPSACAGSADSPFSHFSQSVLVHVEIARRLSHRDPALLDQPYRLDLELMPELSPVQRPHPD